MKKAGDALSLKGKVQPMSENLLMPHHQFSNSCKGLFLVVNLQEKITAYVMDSIADGNFISFLSDLDFEKKPPCRYS